MAAKQKQDRPANYFIVTVRAYRPEADEGGVEYSQNGNVFATCRASVSMGKDKNDQYRPSMWLKLIASGEGDDITEQVEAIGELQNGDYVTVKGRLAYDEWTGDDGVMRQNLTLWVNSIEDFVFQNTRNNNAPAEEEVEEVEDDFI